MMRRSSIVSLSALLLMLTAGCQGMREKPQQEGDTPSYIGVSVRVASDYSGSLRAVTDKQQNEPGIDRERSVSGASLLLRDYVAIPFSFPNASTIADSYESEVKSVYPKGELDMALLVNSSALGSLSMQDYRVDRTLTLSDLPKTYGSSGMLMTSTVADGSKNKGTIYPGKTEAEVRAKAFNHFSFDVERVVAKLQVTMKDGLSLTLPDMGTLSKLTYSMAGSAKETYLFRDHAGSRTLDETGANAIYKDFKSVIYDKTVPDTWDSKDAHPFLQRVSDKEGTDYILGGYFRNPKEVTEAPASPTSIDGGFYFYENSMYGGDKKVADKKGEIKYNRIAYAKVYTKLTPTQAYTTNYSNGKYERVLATPEEFTKEQSYTMEISKELYNKLRRDPAYSSRVSSGWTFKPGGPGYQSYDLQTTDKPGTFYEGGEDELLYLRLRDAVLMGNKTARKYEEGRMVYLIPLNRQLDATSGFVNYCDTRRNNIYNLRIEKISGIGRNYDPVDPNDPNVPKPEDNPFEPPTDPQIPVEPADYFMLITAKVIKWNLVEKHYALWN